MTLPGDAGQPARSGGQSHARHAAPSPSGRFLPPDPQVGPGADPQVGSEADPVTTRIPRIEADAAAGSHRGGDGPDAWPGESEAPSPAEVSPSAVSAAPDGLTSVAAPAETAYQDPAYQQPAHRRAGHAGAELLEAEPRPAGRHAAGRPSALRLVWIYPDLLSTYGDRGNLIMLARRARLRGIEIDAIGVNSDQKVPRLGDVYLLGGGEDLPQVLAAQRLRADGGLAAAASDGAVIFAVCAGYQLIGSVFGGAQGEPVDGLGLLDVRSGRGERRGVGEVVADVDPALGIDRLTGFENHQGVTTPGPAARPLARTRIGVGNGDGTEGAYAGRILGTYLHGPALVRNPGLADLLLTWAAGSPLPALADADDAWTKQLRKERLAAVAA